MLVASDTKARLASSLTCRSSIEGWKPKSNCSRVRWKGRWANSGLGGDVALLADGHFSRPATGPASSAIGQLLVGRGVQRVVQDLNGLLEARGLQVLAGLFQGDHRHLAPPAAARLVDLQGAPFHLTHRDLHRQCLLLAGRPSVLGRPSHWPGRVKRCPALLSPRMHRQTLLASPDLHRARVAGLPAPWRPPTSSGPRSGSPPS